MPVLVGCQRSVMPWVKCWLSFSLKVMLLVLSLNYCYPLMVSIGEFLMVFNLTSLILYWRIKINPFNGL